MKYALVTGCDHGVGLELARALASRGYTVVACRLNPEEKELDALAEACGASMLIRTLDISSDESVRNLLPLPIPHLDLLINCAGILGDMENGPEDPLHFDRMLKVINVNALGTLRVTAALFPLIKAGADKTVLNISSEAGSIADCPRTGWYGYCMSKAANNMQGALIHNTLRSLGGKVIQMHPGHVATWMRGYQDTTARITARESAEGILHTVLDTCLPVRERPLYLDYTGAELPW